MNTSQELVAMESRMFTDELFHVCLKAYTQELKENAFEEIECAYLKATAALTAHLPKEQKSRWMKIETLYHQNARYALKFAFHRGMYAGFQQFFCKTSPPASYEELVVREILLMPAMESKQEYYTRRMEHNRIFQLLMTQLTEEYQEHMISVVCALDERINGIMRHSFYLGYRYAHKVLQNVVPPSALFSIEDKILLTEHELGFPHPF